MTSKEDVVPNFHDVASLHKSITFLTSWLGLSTSTPTQRPRNPFLQLDRRRCKASCWQISTHIVSGRKDSKKNDNTYIFEMLILAGERCFGDKIEYVRALFGSVTLFCLFGLVFPCFIRLALSAVLTLRRCGNTFQIPVGCSGWSDSGQPFSMFVLLSILYFSLQAIRASPLPLPVDISNAPAGVQLPTSCICIHQRSITDILWSCFATLFACTWLSVHPNMLGPDEGFWKITFRRLEIMLWAFISPEMVIAWAARQWFAARWLRDKYGGTIFPS